MPYFVDKHLYSRTGTLLSRLIGFERFFMEHSDISKHLLVIESEKERRDAIKILSSITHLSSNIVHIENVQDLLRYRD